ncbi:MAG: bestrophin family ion channel [Flammeovirgaceae bacterium]
MKDNWFLFLFKSKPYQFPGMLSSMVSMGLVTAFAVFLHNKYNILEIPIPTSFHTVLGLVVGLLLVFRTNTAYERWWEGRRQLGTMVNSLRNLAIQVEASLTNHKYSEKNILKKLIASYSWCLKNHLREQDFSLASQKLPENVINKFMKAPHKPNFLVLEISKHLQKALEQKHISNEQLLSMQNDIKELVNVQGACERIRNTPMPMGYALHLKRILLIYIVTLPIGFIDELQWWAVPTVMLIFYTMVGIERMGEEIEDPFGTDPNDLPFDGIDERVTANMNTLISDNE